MTLIEIFNKYGIELKSNDQFRHPVDILEDIYLKLNNNEYNKMMELISKVESSESFIFDEARSRPYQ
jgi:hypothetical protein